jgi:hypothetical protein
MQPQTRSEGSPSPASSSLSAKQLLETVLKEIRDFDAKKLTELKGELEGFVKKQQGLVDDYRKQYPELKRRWCVQHTDVETLYAQLKTTHDPLKDPWKKLVSQCIGAKQKDVDCLAEAIGVRRRCGFGELEYAFDQAKAKFAAAKVRLDVLLALSAKADATLTSHATWIKDIKNLAGPERASVLYLFWIRLLPAHRSLMPSDLGGEVVMPGEAEAPEKICAAERAETCKPDPWACAPPSAGGAAGGAGDTERALPWLMPPDQYEGALDRAWDEYRKAKNELAVADAAFKSKPDDLASKVKEHGTRKEGLEADILACLKAWKPSDPCVEAEPAPQRGESTQQRTEPAPQPAEPAEQRAEPRQQQAGPAQQRGV